MRLNVRIPQDLRPKMVVATSKANDAIALDLWKELVDTTPVKTGRTRFNWQIAPTSSRYLINHPPGEYSYPRTPVVERTTTNVIGNKTPYLIYLNAGSSRQAPALFIEKAIDKVIRRRAPSQIIRIFRRLFGRFFR